MRLLFTALACLTSVSLFGQNKNDLTSKFGAYSKFNYSHLRIELKEAEQYLKPFEKIKYYDNKWNEIEINVPFFEFLEANNKVKRIKYYRVYELSDVNGIMYQKIRDYDRKGNIIKDIEYSVLFSDNDDDSVLCGRINYYNIDGLDNTVFAPKFNYTKQNDIVEYLDSNETEILEGVWRVRSDFYDFDFDVLIWFSKDEKKYSIFEIETGNYISTLISTSDYSKINFKHYYKLGKDEYVSDVELINDKLVFPKKHARNWTYSKLYPK